MIPLAALLLGIYLGHLYYDAQAQDEDSEDEVEILFEPDIELERELNQDE